MKIFAISSWPCKYPDDLLPLARSAAFRAIEWDLNFMPLPLSIERRKALWESLFQAETAVRYHLPYSTFDIGNVDANVQRVSEVCLGFIVDLLAEGGLFHAVVHFGASSGSGIHNLDGLVRLVQGAKLKGGSIAIENLRVGPTANPRILREIALASGGSIALDVGHARTAGCLEEYLDIVGDMITHVHFYDREDDWLNHIPFSDAAAARETASLIHESCSANWWTFEMDSKEACIDNCNMIKVLDLDC